jgi:hypothetical protein
MQTRKKTRIVEEEEQASTKLANGMGGVMNERGLEGRKMQKMNVDDGALAHCNVNEKQMQSSDEVGETFTTDLASIEITLQKMIKMTVE